MSVFIPVLLPTCLAYSIASSIESFDTTVDPGYLFFQRSEYDVRADSKAASGMLEALPVVSMLDLCSSMPKNETCHFQKYHLSYL
jgi:hypothetical protein